MTSLEDRQHPVADKKQAEKARSQTIKRLSGLGLKDTQIARACRVTTPTVQAWLDGDKGPFGISARAVVDRLGAIVGHMDEDLGLTPATILRFIQEEPTRTPEERGLETDIQWTERYESFCQSPLFTNLGLEQCWQAVAQRLQLRFPERYAEIMPNAVTSPVEDYAVIHSVQNANRGMGVASGQ